MGAAAGMAVMPWNMTVGGDRGGDGGGPEPERRPRARERRARSRHGFGRRTAAPHELLLVLEVVLLLEALEVLPPEDDLLRDEGGEEGERDRPEQLQAQLKRPTALLRRQAVQELELGDIRPDHQHDHRDRAAAEVGHSEQSLFHPIHEAVHDARRARVAQACTAAFFRRPICERRERVHGERLEQQHGEHRNASRTEGEEHLVAVAGAALRPRPPPASTRPKAARQRRPPPTPPSCLQWT